VHSCTRQSDPEGQKYALKTIEKSGIKKCKRNIQSVLMEIDILRTLKHPFIIKLHEVYESNKYIHLVLCYLDGGELFERIKSRQVYQESIAISVMRNMLEALDFMHKNDVVHRDLKPENLILASKDNDYDLRIADFGLAAFAKPGELLKLRCGSPGYVAPELLDDVGYEQKADIFSAGVIFYVLLTGRPAFRGYNINEILIKNKKCEVEYPAKYWDNISDKAKDLVDKML
jgi:calcium-dependent protein kinase